MELSAGLSATQLDQYSSRTGDAVTLSTMRKTLDIQASLASQLIASVPAPAPAPSSSNLGQIVDVMA